MYVAKVYMQENKYFCHHDVMSSSTRLKVLLKTILCIKKANSCICMLLLRIIFIQCAINKILKYVSTTALDINTIRIKNT